MADRFHVYQDGRIIVAEVGTVASHFGTYGPGTLYRPRLSRFSFHDSPWWKLVWDGKATMADVVTMGSFLREDEIPAEIQLLRAIGWTTTS